ncbi:DUF3429 domain-containing protein [Halopseudomonas phragmitis]|uniref:DUF3429 domain-containing protein n=2 Tax=Pseudomonadaceae TaxID=135621 RepID=A0A1V0B6V6_9GAMM|nr:MULTISPECIES: DUF3429 domain-containing protein [Pseudomonadaceae]AQZ95658.1 DUF3429 domain-containing protein [Halopseudomonas phragmitis]RHW22625.1 DUF3429 domain-containing protein [Pseudomonas jilinensis]
MHPFNAIRPPRLAVGLGMVGMIPFVTGALGLWVTPEVWRERVMEELLGYAAVILAFMGAIHWGLAMRAEESSEKAPFQLGLSVIPPLLGWVALSLPIGLAIPVFFFAYAALYYADIWAVNHGLAPVWYPALRKPLSIVVILSLLVAWAATLITH